MSKLLKKAISTAILPAILMIASKFLGIFLLIAFYELDFSIGNEISGIFSTQVIFSDSQTTLFVNSISDLLLFVTLCIPTLYMIIQTTIFQSARENPKTIAKVVKLNMLKWVTDSKSTFLKIFVWTSFVLITASLIISNAIKGSTFMWIGIVAGTLSLLCIWGLIKTFEIETNKIYPDSRHSYY